MGNAERWVAFASVGIVAGCGGTRADGAPHVVDADLGAGVTPVPVATETSGREPIRRPPPPPATVAADPGCGPHAHDCRGMNDCKGLGGCKVDGQNDCKGKNDCKGMGGCKTC